MEEELQKAVCLVFLIGGHPHADPSVFPYFGGQRGGQNL